MIYIQGNNFFLRHYVHNIRGKEVRVPRGKASPAPDAIPTILLNLSPLTLWKKRLPRGKEENGKQSFLFTTRPMRNEVVQQSIMTCEVLVTYFDKIAVFQTSYRAVFLFRGRGVRQICCGFSQVPASCHVVNDFLRDFAWITSHNYCEILSFDMLQLQNPTGYSATHQFPNFNGVIYATAKFHSETIYVATDKMVQLSRHPPTRKVIWIYLYVGIRYTRSFYIFFTYFFS